MAYNKAENTPSFETPSLVFKLLAGTKRVAAAEEI